MNGGGQEFWVTHFFPGDSNMRCPWLSIIYNSLCRLARKYLSIQATSTPAERVMSEMGIVLEKKRQSMSAELFNEIMFLSDVI